MWRRATFRLLAVVVGLAAGLLATEAALRVHAAIADRDPEGQLRRTAAIEPRPFPGDCLAPGVVQSGLGELVRPSPHPGVVYELKPNLDTCYYGARFRTNGQGLRASRDYERPKPAGVWRLLLLGDSITAGQGVRLSQTWGAVLERRLLKRAPRWRIEVINTAVDGYNTAQEAAVLGSVGMSYEPDCVLVLFVQNDLELPSFLLSTRDPLTLRRSFLWTFLQWRCPALGPPAPVDEFSPLVWHEAARVPTAYRRMVGFDAYARALRSMAATVEESGAPIVQLADYPDGERWSEMRRLQAELGIALPGFNEIYRDRYWLGPDNHHLNAAGHARLARIAHRALRTVPECLPPG